MNNKRDEEQQSLIHAHELKINGQDKQIQQQAAKIEQQAALVEWQAAIAEEQAVSMKRLEEKLTKLDRTALQNPNAVSSSEVTFESDLVIDDQGKNYTHGIWRLSFMPIYSTQKY